MGRLSHRLAELSSRGRKALAVYIMAGDPDPESTVAIAKALEEAGTSVLELGMPFSDPMADGVVIQRASERALSRGMTPAGVLKIVRRIRARSEIPILLMGYYNPILRYGRERFARDAAKSGVDAILIVDLPPEEAGGWRAALRRRGLDAVFLVSPLTPAGRISLVERIGSGFLYYVTLTGVTGAGHLDPAEVRRRISALKHTVKLPVLAGFGIRTPAQVKSLSRSADGVVVGSSVVSLISRTPRRRLYAAVGRYVGSLSGALWGA